MLQLRTPLQGVSWGLLELPCFALSRRSSAQLLIEVEHHGVEGWWHIFGVYAHGSETWPLVRVELVAALGNLLIDGGALLPLAHVFNDDAQLKRKGQRLVTSSQKIQQLSDVFITTA